MVLITRTDPEGTDRAAGLRGAPGLRRHGRAGATRTCHVGPGRRARRRAAGDRVSLWNNDVFLREGRELPPATRIWFRAPRCTTADEFELLADWLGVTGPNKPRFDGDIRPPYRLRVHVTEGPAEYVGATIGVHADAATAPTLGPEDVKTSLWEGGQVVAEVKCDAGRFQALSLRVPTPH